jgi:chaperone modulatory protein CbpM
MTTTLLTCTAIDETTSYSLRECCHLCRVNAQTIHEMIDEGLITPVGESPQNWCFGAAHIRRIQITLRLQQDLRINLPGAALALDLLDELAELQQKNSHNQI